MLGHLQRLILASPVMLFASRLNLIKYPSKVPNSYLTPAAVSSVHQDDLDHYLFAIINAQYSISGTARESIICLFMCSSGTSLTRRSRGVPCRRRQFGAGFPAASFAQHHPRCCGFALCAIAIGYPIYVRAFSHQLYRCETDHGVCCDHHRRHVTLMIKPVSNRKV